MIKLVALDLDGTLLSSFGVLSEEAADTLRKLRKKGITVTISSGRPLYSVAGIIPEDCYDYASCLNGQEIYIKKEDRHLYQPLLSEEEKTYLAAYLKKYRMLMHCSINNQGYYLADESHASFVHLYEDLNALRHKLAHQPNYDQDVSYDCDMIRDQKIAKLCFCGFPWTLRKFIAKIDASRFSCFFVNNSWLEICHLGVSKGSAIRKIMAMDHLEPEECAAFGDGENDLSMFAECGTRVAMANAMRSLKKQATSIARPNIEDGCAKWLQKHLLKK